MSNSEYWIDLEKKYLMKVFTRPPIVLVKGKGARVWDQDGNEYLDFVGGIAVNSLGHCPPVVTRALREQSKKIIQTSNLFYTIPQLQLAQLLVEHSCFEEVFFGNSGAEANEGAVKLARRYGKLHLDGAFEVITTYESFHGRTLAMVAASGQANHQEPYTPLPEGFLNVKYNDIQAIKCALSKRTCAVMVEPIQGEGGVNVPDDSYLRELRELCDSSGILLILDEIQTGIGRTGTLFAYEQSGIQPDIMSLAKGLASGVPIGAFLATKRAAVFQPGDHGSTFGGNPLVCAASYAALSYIIDNDISGHVQRIGNYFVKKLEQLKARYSFITSVRGRGLLLALGFSGDIAGKLVDSCLHQGLLLNRVKPDTIRFIPPLIITEKDIDRALNILDGVL